MRFLLVTGIVIGFAGMAGTERPGAVAAGGTRQEPIALPDSAGMPTRILATARRSNDDVWIGTYGRGVFVRPRAGGVPSTWRHLHHVAQDSTSISFDFVNAIAFGPRGEIWYGTVGNGWGLSSDAGKSWRNWTFSALGPEWQYVAPDGIVTSGDTVVIGTADGLQVSIDDGEHWVAIGDAVGPATRGPADTAIEVLPSEYVTAVSRLPTGWVVHHLRGTTRLNVAGCLLRAHGDENATCALATSAVPRHPDPVGLRPVARAVVGSAKGWSPWFARPIAAEDNDRIDQMYRWGSTMGGNFQPHQGVEFNNPDGTPVHAIGDGIVVYAGRAEAGALTVGIRQDTMLVAGGKKLFVFSVYYHNSALLVHVGDRVHRGDVISRVGNTGRATNDHIHLEVHAAPTDSVKPIIDSLNRYPPYTTNPELWIAPLPGTGVVAGTVVDSAGVPVPQARVFGIVKPDPRETPFVYAETYGPRNRSHPVYGENFAVSDVPAGTYHLFVVINGRRVVRTAVVRPGAMTWVQFHP